jgi:phosphoribosylamine---glycine ligase
MHTISQWFLQTHATLGIKTGEKMNILIVGNGGREHAICWKVAQSKNVKNIWVASGNAGTAREPKTKNIKLSPTDIEGLVTFAQENKIDLTIVGPEAPLAAGIVDAFNHVGLKCFGPSKAAAQLESSKTFCKQFMQKNHIPTANFATFDEVEPALTYVRQQSFPLVIKADGLAAGKGVVIAENLLDAEKTIHNMLTENQFGTAGSRIVIEEFLQGEELSFIAIVDGEHVLPLASSQDHKRRDDGDLGPNTGGMGAYSPAPLLTDELSDQIMQKIMQPTVDSLKKMGTPYVGFLYAGIMVSNGKAKVLEFNCRLGDPETQPILFRLQSDLTELCLGAFHQQLNQIDVKWDPRPALAVVLASGGYPNKYRKGDHIQGLEKKNYPAHCKVFHAGTTLSDHKVLTNGGRVLAVTALGNTLQTARDEAYLLAEQITWPERFYRHDIGHRALKSG